MIILSVDSSSSCATAALISNGNVVSELNITDKKQHSEILMTMIDSLLNFSNLNIKDVDAYVVSKGPGSFTGLRIGMATLKGLSLGSKKPILSISNLDGLAYNVSTFSGIICPIMDALRGNVYTALYKNVAGNLERLTDYMILSIDELLITLKEKDDSVIFVGDGTEKHSEVLRSSLVDCILAPKHLNYTRACTLGLIGEKLIQQGYHDESDAAPFYIRKSQAEREYDKKMGLD